MSPQVTFFTNCWEGDWRYLLKTPRLQNMIENNAYDFKEKILCISNVDDISLVKKQAEQLIKKKIITSYFVAQDYTQMALDFFKLTPAELKQSYKYSIPPLTSLYLCKTDYLLHHTGDVILPQRTNWVSPSLKALGQNKKFVVANPVWDGKHDSVKSESFEENDSFFIGFGFSDQYYLIKRDTFRQPIYNEWNDASSRYPDYGMWGFERRIDSWMRNHDFHRLTYKFASYRHDSFPKNIWKQRLEVFFGTRDER